MRYALTASQGTTRATYLHRLVYHGNLTHTGVPVTPFAVKLSGCPPRQGISGKSLPLNNPEIL